MSNCLRCSCCTDVNGGSAVLGAFQRSRDIFFQGDQNWPDHFVPTLPQTLGRPHSGQRDSRRCKRILSTVLTLNKHAKGASENMADVVTQMLFSHTSRKSRLRSPQNFDSGKVRSNMKGNISPSCPIIRRSAGSLSNRPAANKRRMCSPVSECQLQLAIESMFATWFQRSPY